MMLRNAGNKMKKIDGRRILEILLIIVKVILAIPLAAAFLLIRCVQYFYKNIRNRSLFCLYAVFCCSLFGSLSRDSPSAPGKRSRFCGCGSDYLCGGRSYLCTCCGGRTGYGYPGGSLQLDMAFLYGKIQNLEIFLQKTGFPVVGF